MFETYSTRCATAKDRIYRFHLQERSTVSDSVNFLTSGYLYSMFGAKVFHPVIQAYTLRGRRTIKQDSHRRRRHALNRIILNNETHPPGIQPAAAYPLSGMLTMPDRITRVIVYKMPLPPHHHQIHPPVQGFVIFRLATLSFDIVYCQSQESL